MTDNVKGLIIGAGLVGLVLWLKRPQAAPSTLDGTMPITTLAGGWTGASDSLSAWANRQAVVAPPGGGQADSAPWQTPSSLYTDRLDVPPDRYVADPLSPRGGSFGGLYNGGLVSGRLLPGVGDVNPPTITDVNPSAGIALLNPFV